MARPSVPYRIIFDLEVKVDIMGPADPDLDNTLLVEAAQAQLAYYLDQIESDDGCIKFEVPEYKDMQ